MPYDNLPSNCTLDVKPFKAHVSEEDLHAFKVLLKHSRIGPETYENQTTDVKNYTSFGIRRDWLVEAKHHWEHGYDWRKTEERINSYPNFTADISDLGFTFKIHFACLLSKKQDAIPLVLLHGWPGSFLEFLGVMDEFKKQFDENSLPFHVIVPSLPGYGYSNGPMLDKNFNTEGMSRVIDKLMIGLGFGSGYVAQGGDIGSFISRILSTTSESCKAVHFNMIIGVAPEEDDLKAMNQKEQQHLGRINDFATVGNAYAREHGTRPATIGLVLSSSPIALLAWIGEKFLQWSDTSPPLNSILDGVTLYWFTESFPRAIYPYRQFFGANPTFFHNEAEYITKIPMGFSLFPQELSPTPIGLAKKTGNLAWHREHEKGGHFAALERPQNFVEDMIDFAKAVWADAKKA